jgi:hypothetical protein
MPVIVVRVEPGGVVNFVATVIEVVGGGGGIALDDVELVRFRFTLVLLSLYSLSLVKC